MIDLDPTTLIIITSIVVPFLVSAVTKLSAPDKIKNTLTLILTAAVAFLGNAVTENGHAVFSLTSMKDWAVSLAVAVAGGYYGIIKPRGWAAKLAPTKGIG